MVAAYVEAGFTKIHLDASMGCAGEPPRSPTRSPPTGPPRLAAGAEARRPGQAAPPVYVIGTEVPVPGGALEALDHLEVTEPRGGARTTVEIHRRAFAALRARGGLRARIGLVVQPGVEFGNEDVIVYEPAKARSAQRRARRACRSSSSRRIRPTTSRPRRCGAGPRRLRHPQGRPRPDLRPARGALRARPDRGGTQPGAAGQSLSSRLERVMLADPRHWRSYYPGSPQEQHTLRHYSYSDRVRYYWPVPEVQAAVDDLFRRLSTVRSPRRWSVSSCRRCWPV